MQVNRQSKNMMAAPHRQRGAVIVLLAAAMLALLASAGLALDVSHQLINKTRLQNTVDAAALAGAKVLDQTTDPALAAAAVQAMFADNADDPGNFELNNAAMTPTVQFSNTVAPFVPGTTPALYVRVTANDFVMPAWLIQVIGISQKSVSATAVSGPSPTINSSCNLVPLIMCARDLTQDPSIPGNTFWGFDDGQVHRLKSGANSEKEVGDGVFQLAELGGTGADVVRENLAGGYNGCVTTSSTVPTQPGNQAGPVAQGLNTRFNQFSGPISPGDYPPDVIIEEQMPPGLEYGSKDPLDIKKYDASCPSAITLGGTCVNSAADLDFNYDDYQSRIAANSLDIPEAAGGAFDRRTMPVMVADCTAAGGGKQDLPLLGFGCFFLLQKTAQNGQESEIFGEFAEDCATPGFSGPAPTVIPGPHIIQLYKDSDGVDS
jgi:hypothetical protein